MKILLVGNSPLPNSNSDQRPAAGLRTWQFWSAINSSDIKNLSIKLVKINICSEESKNKNKEIELSKNSPKLLKDLQSIHDEFNPEIIIGVNTHPCFLISKLTSDAAFWADLNGWIMAEAQAQAHKLDSDQYIPHYYSMEKSILAKADKFSSVSKAQYWSIHGELASYGRLNHRTFNYQFLEHIPNGTEKFDNDSMGKLDAKKNIKKYDQFNELNFNVGWIGGYNTWADEQTLFKSLELAMTQCPKLRFISTGGEIEGLDNKTFRSFLDKIQNSKFKNNFKFLGWVPTNNMPLIYSQIDCGINVDLRCVETFTGARNRLNELMKFGIPVITTLGSEIANQVEKYKCGLTAPNGDSKSLSKQIIKMYKEWEQMGTNFKKKNTYGENGKKYIQDKCNYLTTTYPLIKWIQTQKDNKLKNDSLIFAPDKDYKINLGFKGKLKSSFKYLKDRGIRQSLRKFWQKVK